VIVVLDSSVICADFHMDGDTFRMFFEGASSNASFVEPDLSLFSPVNR